MAHRPLNWLLGGFLLQACLVACGDAGDGDGGPLNTGGTVGTGGTAPSTGGTGTGGSTGGTAPSTGGISTGGFAMGGSSTGGSATGGSSTGGASGGNNSGGKATGGSNNTGGSTGGKATGGNNNSGGKATGGNSNTGGSTGGKAAGGTSTGGTTGGTTGGKATGGSGTGGSTGGTTNTGAGPTTTCGCLKSAGEFGSNPIGSTIMVDGGEVYDGKCMTFRASNALGDGTQAEGQKPIFIINNGTLQNVIIGNSAADGVHIEGKATLKNIHWLDIGEDAMSVGSSVGGSPTVDLDCGSSAQGSDKTFQVNAVSTWTIRNFTAKTAGKFMRQNGSSTFKMTLTIDHCDIADMSECIYRTDSTSSIVNMTNTRYHNIGDSLFIFGSANVNGDTHDQVGTFSGNVSY
jgi:pectate lyase C